MLRQIRNLANQTWDTLLVFCGMLFVLIPTSPLVMSNINRDSGVFLYIGWRILNGELPYRDIWDQKPPVIFYLNSLGLAISGNSRWSVWFIECVAIFIAAWIGFRLIKKTMGALPAIFSLLIWLLALTYFLSGGNLTEEYTLPLQFAALWLIGEPDKANLPFYRWFLIGLLGSIAFFTKQTTIGIWVAIILYLFIQRLTAGQIKSWFRELAFILIGALPTSIAIVVFFAAQGGLSQFLSAAFKYNSIYPISIGVLSRVKYVVATGITTLAHFPTPLFYFFIIGYAVGLILIIFKRSLVTRWAPLLAVGLIDIPIELILVSISGRNYPHYYISMLPVLSLFIGILFWMIFSQLSSWNVPKPGEYVFFGLMIGIILASSFRDYHSQITSYSKARDNTAVNTIKSLTAPDDTVLLWGAESVENFLAQRRSPTRFVYQYPLYQQGYTDEQLILEFLGEVIQNKPRIIIDTKNELTPLYTFPVQSPAISKDIAELKSHYKLTDNIGFWSVYTYTPIGNSP